MSWCIQACSKLKAKHRPDDLARFLWSLTLPENRCEGGGMFIDERVLHCQQQNQKLAVLQRPKNVICVRVQFLTPLLEHFV